jgi:hypothetical protein
LSTPLQQLLEKKQKNNLKKENNRIKQKSIQQVFDPEEEQKIGKGGFHGIQRIKNTARKKINKNNKSKRISFHHIYFASYQQLRLYKDWNGCANRRVEIFSLFLKINQRNKEQITKQTR